MPLINGKSYRYSDVRIIILGEDVTHLMKPIECIENNEPYDTGLTVELIYNNPFIFNESELIKYTVAHYNKGKLVNLQLIRNQ